MTAAVCVGAFFGMQTLTSHAAAKPTAAASQPAPGRGFGGGAAGTVTSISGDAIQIADRSGAAVTIATSSDTTFTKAAAGSVSDLKVGDHVTAGGTTSAGLVMATRITDSGSLALTSGAPRTGKPTGTPPSGSGRPPGTGRAPPPGAGPGSAGGTFANGTIASVSASGITVTQPSGDTVSMNIAASTNVSLVRASSLQQIAVGDTVVARGSSSNGTVAATSVVDGDTGFGGGPGRGPAQGANGG